jgi:hypothetical protein
LNKYLLENLPLKFAIIFALVASILFSIYNSESNNLFISFVFYFQFFLKYCKILYIFITDAFDFDLCYDVLRKLKSGKGVELPIYDFKTHSRYNSFLVYTIYCAKYYED